MTVSTVMWVGERDAAEFSEAIRRVFEFGDGNAADLDRIRARFLAKLRFDAAALPARHHEEVIAEALTRLASAYSQLRVDTAMNPANYALTVLDSAAMDGLRRLRPPPVDLSAVEVERLGDDGSMEAHLAFLDLVSNYKLMIDAAYEAGDQLAVAVLHSAWDLASSDDPRPRVAAIVDDSGHSARAVSTVLTYARSWLQHGAPSAWSRPHR